MATATMKIQAATDEAAIREVIEARHKAHHNKDAAAIVAPYAADATIFNLAPPLVHRGVDLKEKQAWLDTWEGPVDLESRDFEFTVSGDFAFGHGFLQMTGTSKPAGRQIGFWMRETVCLHREDSGWKIVHEHASVPFYMDGSLRPAFDLKP